ncbi:phosphonopyruvate decarboxylase [Bradyrhizobium sp. WSM 1738]|uniref:phosphonopyruvate decarboxylase n=1 Tax=Bradyrhizobium hereditatis TaxID=2821405 RepID=UPI001CE333FA|nr:phosphonopyruvate decarboxylase [Bradyrhizobium hereditatis]MCA6115250.1 phosphonopyruvate decarboxylase [Bradyrhizobium hereditatis]
MSLLDILAHVGVQYVCGVPDSTLESFIAEVIGSPMFDHQIASCEGSAVSLAAGQSMATGRPCCVYMQNSGLPNALNPLLSMFSPAVYDIPLILIIGWRGEPGTVDEPQHMVMGGHTLKFLELLGMDPLRVTADTSTDPIQAYVETSVRDRRNAALLVSKGATLSQTDSSIRAREHLISFDESIDRLAVIDTIVRTIPESSIVFSSTGYAAREIMLYSSRECGRSYVHLPCVGGMGFTSSFAIGVSQADPDRNVYCIDGDGSFLMHGLSSSVAPLRNTKFRHIVLNNGCHNSAGGFATSSNSVDFVKIAEGLGYSHPRRVANQSRLEAELTEIASSSRPGFIEIRCGLQSFGKLPRPDRRLTEYKKDYLVAMGRQVLSPQPGTTLADLPVW